MIIRDNSKAGDAPPVLRLLELERIAERFSVAEILGDKGCNSAKIRRLIAEMGATAYIPFKKISGKKGLDYRRAYLRYEMDQESFGSAIISGRRGRRYPLTDYHRQSDRDSFMRR